ncbi:MAG: cbb3-type cytochrome c oxidase subunit I [Verrucomicrobiales bacterium]|nr:cbb3-type cytochrome c oxidase subunit I [Verrucomicrobiales bacterium]
MNILKIIDQRKNWWKIFVIIFAVSICVVGYIGYKTYEYAPPRSNFVDAEGKVIFSAEEIQEGQKVFLSRGLMDYGSYLGDGGMRGPDYTGEALNNTAKWMNEFYAKEWVEREPDAEIRETIVRALVQKEIKKNTYVADYYSAKGKEQSKFEPGAIVMSRGQVYAANKMVTYYTEMFAEGGDLVGAEAFRPENYITDKADIKNITAFFYWGGWLCGAARPGYDYSYTQNWPYDPLAGNLPHGGLVLWSIIGVIVVIAFIGTIFYYYGKLDPDAEYAQEKGKMPPLATSEFLDKFKPTPTQVATYKYFAVACILFGIQVLAGLLTVMDFVHIFDKMGLQINHLFPVTVTRAWHEQISVLWIAVCWFAATIWVLPLICRPEPSGQLKWVNALFWVLLVVGVGGAIGIPLGIGGVFEGEMNRWFGLQGWEFMTIGRFYQYLLFVSFSMWLVIIMRGLWPALKQKQTWSLPNWMVYAIAGMIFMFTASFVASPDTSFVIADFWRWCTIHMWVEAFFEVFTTIIVAYFMYLMGFVSHRMAARVVYMACLLFLGSGLIGIAHNFYWNAKSIETIALGGVLSSLQVAPLVLLTVTAWRFRNMPESTLAQLKKEKGVEATFGLGTAFLFLVGVNFWNFFGAGVLGFSVNLPIVNYYQHGSYLTVNHAHAALFGVYGNLGIAAMLFCARWNVIPSRWNDKLLRRSFWSLNLGLSLMVLMDLFPVGVHQLIAIMDKGYAYGRSQVFLDGDTFQFFTWMRSIGVIVFIVGGVLPLLWFMVSRWFSLRVVQTPKEQFVVPKSVLALAGDVDPFAGTSDLLEVASGDSEEEEEEDEDEDEEE